jgi:hypothetical protein
MASSYSTSLKIQLIGGGEQSGVWGTTTNTNWNLIEEAVAGVRSITMANSNYTLSNLNGVSDEARNMVLVVGGTNSAIYQVIAPLVNKYYVVFNNTSGGYAITIGGATGSVISIPNGVTAQVYCDGTNFYSALTGAAGNFNINGTLTAGGISDLGSLTAASLTVSGNSTFTGTTTHTGTATFNGSAAFNGTTTVPTTATGDNSTSAASTALVTNKIAAITSVANAVQLTTGSSNYFTVYQSGTKLYFAYNGSTIASIDSSGNLIAKANITAYGTP